MARDPQLLLDLLPEFGWGGERARAGRKPAGEAPGISHRRGIEMDARFPVLVTLRCRPHVWNLRSHRSFVVVAKALRGVLGRADFRVVHFSVQGNHVHLIAEAGSPDALANGMRALSGRMTIGLNRMMGRRGSVFADRYHARVLRTPAEVKNAVAYLLGNFASHAARRGERVPGSFVDPHSSAAERGPDGLPPPVSAARSWLLLHGPSVAREPEAVYGLAA
jgi:REP element-mobilizing transposase RayT